MAEGKREEEGWVRVQKKTFTRWCNSYLRRRKNGPGGEGILVEDLYADLEDGFRLNNLLQIISNGGGDKNDPDKAKFKVRVGDGSGDGSVFVCGGVGGWVGGLGGVRKDVESALAQFGARVLARVRRVVGEVPLLQCAQEERTSHRSLCSPATSFSLARLAPRPSFGLFAELSNVLVSSPAPLAHWPTSPLAH